MKRWHEKRVETLVPFLRYVSFLCAFHVASQQNPSSDVIAHAAPKTKPIQQETGAVTMGDGLPQARDQAPATAPVAQGSLQTWLQPSLWSFS